jgi:Leu/Phe-tRNA-protein transferase
MGILSFNNFLLLDVQFMTDHLKTLGAKEISRSLFLHLINGSHINKVQFKKPSALIIDKHLINQAEKNLLVGIREL